MNQERAELLMNRAIDGIATRDEREQLARAMRADPLLHSEFEELQAVHGSTLALFSQLELPANFSRDIMRRIQADDVPADAGLDTVRLPAQRRRRGTRRFAAAAAARRARVRVRVYAVIATVSAAAAVMLALGVFTGFFARAGIGAQGATQQNDVAGGRQGGPGRGELNRTDSSTHQPHEIQGGTPKNDSRPDKDRTDEWGDLPPLPKRDIKAHPEEPTPPEPTSEPKRQEAVDNGKDKPAKPDTDPKKRVEPPLPAPEKKPDALVEKKPEKPVDGKTTEVKAKPRGVLLGRVSEVLSGRAELSSDGQTWNRINEDEVVYQGDHVRTQSNGTVLLALDAGNVTLDHGTDVQLCSADSLKLVDGTVALDRKVKQGDLDVVVEDYTLHLSYGCALVERKRHGVSVQKIAGFASLSHDKFGSVLLDADSSCEIEADFGKAAGEPKPLTTRQPAWLRESRSQVVVQALGPALDNRHFAARERNYLMSRLPGGVEKLMAGNITTESVSDFLTCAIGNKKLSGMDILHTVSELQLIYLDVADRTPDAINVQAGRAAMVAEGFDQWRSYLYRLLRSPSNAKAQPSNGNASNSSKLKRDNSQPRNPGVKSTNNDSSSKDGK